MIFPGRKSVVRNLVFSSLLMWIKIQGKSFVMSVDARGVSESPPSLCNGLGTIYIASF